MSGKISRRGLLAATFGALLAPVAGPLSRAIGVTPDPAVELSAEMRRAFERARQDFNATDRSRLYYVINSRGEGRVVPEDRLTEEF